MRNKNTMNPVVLILSVCLSTAALAQGATPGYQPSEWAKIVAAAKKEGKVVVYGGPVAPTMARLREDFEKANPGIVLEYTRAIGTNLFTKIDQERKGRIDGADATVPAELAWLEDLAKEGAFRPLVGPASVGWPKNYLFGTTAPILLVQPYVIAYNTNLVKIPITGYQDLLRPEFKGKIGVPDPIAEAQVAFYDFLEKTQGAGYLAKLAAQTPRIFTGAVPMTQSTASGEIAVVPSTVLDLANPLIAQGAPLKVVMPPASLGIGYGAGAFNWATRPNAAMVFIDYLMSVRAQTLWHSKGESASPLPNIPGALDGRTIKLYERGLVPQEAMAAYREKWAKLFNPR